MNSLELFKLMESKNPKKEFKSLLDAGLSPNAIVDFIDTKNPEESFHLLLLSALLLSLYDEKEFKKLKPTFDLLIKEGAEINLPEKYNYSKTIIQNILIEKIIPLDYMIEKGMSLNTFIENKPFIEYIAATHPDYLHHFYPYYKKIIWQDINEELHQKMKEGFDDFKLRQKMNHELTVQKKGNKIKL